jgi:hypothetical protein
VLGCHQPAALPGGQPLMGNVNHMHTWNTKRPLQEKMALLGTTSSPPATRRSTTTTSPEQIELFRNRGMGNYRDLLVTIARTRR